MNPEGDLSGHDGSVLRWQPERIGRLVRPGSGAMLRRNAIGLRPLRHHGRVRGDRVCDIPAVRDVTRRDAPSDVVSIRPTDGADDRHGDGGDTTGFVTGDRYRTSRGLPVSDPRGLLHGYCVAHVRRGDISRTSQDASQRSHQGARPRAAAVRDVGVCRREYCIPVVVQPALVVDRQNVSKLFWFR